MRLLEGRQVLFWCSGESKCGRIADVFKKGWYTVLENDQKQNVWGKGLTFGHQEDFCLFLNFLGYHKETDGHILKF